MTRDIHNFKGVEQLRVSRYWCGSGMHQMRTWTTPDPGLARIKYGVPADLEQN